MSRRPRGGSRGVVHRRIPSCHPSAHERPRGATRRTPGGGHAGDLLGSLAAGVMDALVSLRNLPVLLPGDDRLSHHRLAAARTGALRGGGRAVADAGAAGLSGPPRPAHPGTLLRGAGDRLHRRREGPLGGPALVCLPCFQPPHGHAAGLAGRHQPLLVAIDAAAVLSGMAVCHLVPAKAFAGVGDAALHRDRSGDAVVSR